MKCCWLSITQCTHHNIHKIRNA